ncbi:hypothetical protein G8C92_08025 [Paenibacillus donghaensis]|uniref:hypothetical protein n=1 Tax=Paenibacillus donghaensis TaxID=414771 RepID=UPI00188477EF|nr:hypothetical protein [Paenibacillus donghaensis]MBE9913980.1 hypothetical protein [Paenibacillus donghaensis]
MKKWTALSLSVTLCASLAAVSIVPASSTAHAAAAKESVKISENAQYFGEVKNGVPNGRGTIHWGDSKQFSGNFVNGKREGNGKYINEYVEEGQIHKVVYNGAWKQDKMEGKGTLTHKTIQDGEVVGNEIQIGTFKNGVLQNGYDVIHALADPDYSFTYKNGSETLEMLGSNQGIKTSLKTGQIFSIKYRNGSINKYYTLFPADTRAEQRKLDADLKYLQSIQKKLIPIFDEFEKLSKQLPLK